MPDREAILRQVERLQNSNNGPDKPNMWVGEEGEVSFNLLRGHSALGLGGPSFSLTARDGAPEAREKVVDDFIEVLGEPTYRRDRYQSDPENVAHVIWSQEDK